MLYPFMTLADETEIVHSESHMEDGKEHVQVEIERPVNGGFYSAICILPEYQWKSVQGFSESDVAQLQELLESLAHIIIRLARSGGFENAAGF